MNGECADLGCDLGPVERAQGIRDACAALLDETKQALDTMSVHDGQRLLGFVREIRGWLNGVEEQLT